MRYLLDGIWRTPAVTARMLPRQLTVRFSIIEECHDNAKKIISEHMEVLHGCAKLLLEKEKVHRDEFEALFTMEKSGEANESI